MQAEVSSSGVGVGNVGVPPLARLVGRPPRNVQGRNALSFLLSSCHKRWCLPLPQDVQRGILPMPPGRLWEKDPTSCEKLVWFILRSPW